MARTRITNVRVFDGEALTEPSTITVEGGTITAMEPGPARSEIGDAEVVDGAGGTLLPGLIDAHMHLNGRKDLDALAAHGVTTGFDMASWPAEQTAALRANTGTASFLSAGLPFIGPAGPHSHFGMPDDAIVTDADLVADGVARRLADGSDYIKVVTEAPGLGGPAPEVVRKIVEAAHAADRKVVAHATHVDAFTMSLDSGADVITHVPTENAVTPGIATRMVDRGRIAIPTLTVSEMLTTTMPRPGATYDAARASVRAMLDAGVPVLAGTDAVDAPGLPFSLPHGTTLHRELELLVDAGLTAVETLEAATSLPARHFGLNDRGAIRTGLRADLLLVNGDPTTDITATRNITGVWTHGQRTA